MRLSAVAIVVSLAAVANAQSAYFNFPPEGPCIRKCTDTLGKARFANYDDVDEYGAYFIESLSYTFDSGTPKTISFMMDTGICFSTPMCPSDELALYRSQYQAKKDWYIAHKNTPPPPRPTTAPPTTVAPTTVAPTTTSAPPTTTSLPPLDPAFPFRPYGPCVTGCNNEAGLSMFPYYTEDPKAPYFWQSLAYLYYRGSPDNIIFMRKSGTCMVKCPKEEIAFFGTDYTPRVNWYNANRPAIITTAPVTTTTTTTTAPPTTTTLPPGVDPAYPFKPNGPCVADCINTIGKSKFPNFTDDPKSPYFFESLSYTFDRGSEKTVDFMMAVGMCQGKCPAEENNLYRDQFFDQLNWYNANKPKPTTTTAGPGPVTTTTTTTSSGPVPTGPVNPPGGGFNYPFKPNGACVAGCTVKVGKSMFPNYSEDPKSPYFIQSLAYTFESGSENTRLFMSDAGICMSPCPIPELDLYRAQYPAQKAWYNANKNGNGGNPGPVDPPTKPVDPPTKPVDPPTGPVTPPSGGFNYPFKPNGACVAGCTVKVGKSMFPNYSEDPKSPYFIQSLAYTFESGSENTRLFMTDAGICMGACPIPELDLYRAQYPAQKDWYNANKKGNGGNPGPVDPPTNPVDPPTGPVTPPSGGFNYPFKPNGACVAGCTVKVGKSMFPNYSEDPKSPYFIQSLAYTFESGSENTRLFMTDAGICMSACPIPELDLYRAQYPAQKDWYVANKNSGGGDPTNPTDPTTPVDPNNPTGPPTGPITPPAGGFVYPFEPNGPCVAGCTTKVGLAMFPNYSEDPKSPYFIQSLAYTFESGSENTRMFMTDAGICMGACPVPEIDLYRAQYPAQKAWYLANKNAGGVNATLTPTATGLVTPTESSTLTPTVAPGNGNGNSAAKFAASGLATVLALISAVAVAI